MAVSVLLIDDEKTLLRLLGVYLARNGFTMTCCASSQEVRELPPDLVFDVIVMDLGLPDVEGTELVEYLLATRPGLPIVVSSGSPFDTASLGAANAGRLFFLPKPYLPKALSELLQGLVPG